MTKRQRYRSREGSRESLVEHLLEELLFHDDSMARGHARRATRRHVRMTDEIGC